MSEIFNCENGSPCSCCYALKHTIRDVDILAADNQKLRAVIDSQLVTTDTQHTIAQLRAEIAEVRKDRERLDFFEVILFDQKEDIVIESLVPNSDPPVCWIRVDDNTIGRGFRLREAIDKAMKAAKGGESDGTAHK